MKLTSKLTSISFTWPLHWRSVWISPVCVWSYDTIDHANLIAVVGDGGSGQEHVDHVHGINKVWTKSGSYSANIVIAKLEVRPTPARQTIKVGLQSSPKLKK